MRLTFKLLTTAALSPVLFAQAAHAQTSTAASSIGTAPQDATPAPAPVNSGPQTETPPDNAGLGDIIITATKSATNLQKTPIVVDVIGGDTLSKVGLVNINAIANLAPAINFGQSNGVYTTITIRGVSSQDTTELGDPAIAFDIDGEYINRPINLAASLFDVERIEILRGPQGTLYGRNSTAGAVNIITAKPKLDKLSASITGSAGTYGQIGANGFINIPLGDKVALRLSGLFDKHNGYEKALAGPALDDGNIKAGRARLLIQPTSRLSLIVTGEIIRTTGTGPGTYGVPVPAGTPVGSLPRNIFAEPPTRDPVPGGLLTPQNDSTQKDIRGELNWDFGFAKLTDVIGYRRTDITFFTNMHGLPIFTSDYHYNASFKTFGNEVRLSNGENSPFKWQVGYYYFNEDQTALANIYQAVSPLITRNHAFPRLVFDYPLVNANSNAFFGEFTVPIGGGLSVTGGIRHTTDGKFRNGVQRTLDLATFNASNGATIQYTTSNVGGVVADKKWTYNAVLNWQATPTNMFYAKYTTGYKAGGFTTVNTYGPESLTSYEAGTKNRFANGTIQFNAAAFLYDYKDQQVQTFILLNGVSAASTQNAASSRIYGAEGEFVAAITPDDRFRVTVDYLHARYRNFTAAVVAVGGANISTDLSGNRAAYAPDWTIGVSYSHLFHIGADTLRAEVNTAYKSEFYLAATNYRTQLQQGFTKTDFTLTYAPGNGRFELSAFVRNIENNRTYRFADFTSAIGQNFFRWQFTAPRTAGVRATFNY